jgi:hypothetical protein
MPRWLRVGTAPAVVVTSVLGGVHSQSSRGRLQLPGERHELRNLTLRPPDTFVDQLTNPELYRSALLLVEKRKNLGNVV